MNINKIRTFFYILYIFWIKKRSQSGDWERGIIKLNII